VIETSFCEKYNVNAQVFITEDWESREKKRKKFKKGIIQNLGEITLENGFRAEVRLKLTVEGYKFILDFDDYDGYVNFLETRLFEKFEWICEDQ